MLDFIYAQAARARRRWYERHAEARRRLRQPVISVGNLRVGGTGKTPLVARICEWLIEQGERPAVLSRGYGRLDRVDGAVVVSDGTRVLAAVARAGDEPMMFARHVPGAVVVVAEERYLAGVIAERKLGATVHVLDDGFQHVQLARDLDVLIVRAGESAGDRVLPFGRLREGLDAAARAHLLVVMDADAAGARSEAWTLGVGEACGVRRVVAAAGDHEPVVAFAGIADPQQFFDGLRESGWNVRDALSFRDHHNYTAEDLARVADAVRAAGAVRAVTTAKDAVRLETLGPLPIRCDAVPLTLELDPWETVAACLRAAIERSRAGAAS